MSPTPFRTPIPKKMVRFQLPIPPLRCRIMAWAKNQGLVPLGGGRIASHLPQRRQRRRHRRRHTSVDPAFSQKRIVRKRPVATLNNFCRFIRIMKAEIKTIQGRKYCKKDKIWDLEELDDKALLRYNGLKNLYMIPDVQSWPGRLLTFKWKLMDQFENQISTLVEIIRKNKLELEGERGYYDCCKFCAMNRRRR